MIAPEPGTMPDPNFRLPKQTATVYWVDSDSTGEKVPGFILVKTRFYLCDTTAIFGAMITMITTMTHEKVTLTRKKNMIKILADCTNLQPLTLYQLF